MPEIIIIGAGLTGLSAAYHIKEPCLVLEKNKKPGGLCSSVFIDGFTFDYSGHFLHLHNPQTKSLLDRILPVKLSKISRKASIYIDGKYVPYPFQANLYYLPDKIRNECIDGFINRIKTNKAEKSVNFLNWSKAVFGKGITKHFMKPYNEKLWTVPGTVLTPDWVAPFVPQPKLSEVTAGAIKPQKKDFGYNVSFYYPKAGGCQAVVDSFYNKLNNVKLGVNAERINYKTKSLKSSDGKTLHYEKLISTQPLTELIKNIENLPSHVREAAKRLDWNSVECINLAFKSSAGLGSDPARGQQWLYFPEKKYPFYRVGVYTNILPSMAPEGFYSIYVEISRRPGSAFNLKAALTRALEGLQNAGIIGKHQKPEAVCALNMPYAYVIYDKYRAAALDVIKSFLVKNDIYSIGRYGGWEYSFMESSIIEGKKIAEQLSNK